MTWLVQLIQSQKLREQGMAVLIRLMMKLEMELILALMVPERNLI
jgi:hypothetical protein